MSKVPDGENVPRFVSQYLEELLPVTFNNMDISNLLRKMEWLHSEVCALRHAVKLQTDVGEDLRSVPSSIESRVAVLETRLPQTRVEGAGLDWTNDGGFIGPSVHAGAGDRSRGDLSTTAAGSVDKFVASGSSSTSPTAMTDDAHDMGTGSPEGNVTAAPLNSPKWSYML